MKKYIDRKEFIYFEDTWIPKDPTNKDYILLLQEIQEGKAELVPYVPPAPTWDEIRTKRDGLLLESDWIGVSDAQPKPNKEVWLNYRQTLRDITLIYSKPEDVVWPTKP
jgi:hypothetical protein